MTIPDFSVTPAAKYFSGGRDIHRGLREFNRIVASEAASKGVAVVDVFAISSRAKDDQALLIADGLHPSTKQYRLWLEKILPAARSLLTGGKCRGK